MSNPAGYGLRMKIRHLCRDPIITGKIVRRFGGAVLVQRKNGRHELVGGTAADYTEAKEWASFFAHDIVFSRSAPQSEFCIGYRLG